MEHVSTPAADAATSSATAGISPSIQDFDPAIRLQLGDQFVGMLLEVYGDFERTHQGFGGFMQLLQGCEPGYELTAGNLFALLEPISGAMDDLGSDLAGMLNVRAWHSRAEQLTEEAGARL